MLTSKYALVYDYQYYKEHNADLAALFGDNQWKYLEHFVNSGMKGGGQGSSTFSLAAYKANNLIWLPLLAKITRNTMSTISLPARRPEGILIFGQQKRPTGGNRQGVKEWLAHEEQYQPKQLYCTTSEAGLSKCTLMEVETMKKRTNTAFWVEKESRWCIAVQKNGTRKRFYSSTPGRTGQREAKRKGRCLA